MRRNHRLQKGACACRDRQIARRSPQRNRKRLVAIPNVAAADLVIYVDRCFPCQLTRFGDTYRRNIKGIHAEALLSKPDTVPAFAICHGKHGLSWFNAPAPIGQVSVWTLSKYEAGFAVRCWESLKTGPQWISSGQSSTAVPHIPCFGRAQKACVGHGFLQGCKSWQRAYRILVAVTRIISYVDAIRADDHFSQSTSVLRFLACAFGRPLQSATVIKPHFWRCRVH